MLPQIRPFATATPISFAKSFRACSTWICPSASVRTIIVIVWLPELPPIPATIGISAASATSFSIEPSKTPIDRKSTRLNSSHLGISYAVFCLKKKKKQVKRRTHDRRRMETPRGQGTQGQASDRQGRSQDKHAGGRAGDATANSDQHRHEPYDN